MKLFAPPCVTKNYGLRIFTNRTVENVTNIAAIVKQHGQNEAISTVDQTQSRKHLSA
jgi:hypothetical protein